MVRCLIIFFIAFLPAPGFAQKIDSIKYKNGFLFFGSSESFDSDVFADDGHGAADIVVNGAQRQSEFIRGLFAKMVFVAGYKKYFFLARGEAPHGFLDPGYSPERFRIEMLFLPVEDPAMNLIAFKEFRELFFQKVFGFMDIRVHARQNFHGARGNQSEA